MEGNDEKCFTEQVKSKINYQRKVLISFPHKVYDKFSNFAKEYANDCYWLAFEKVIDDWERNKVKEPQIIMLMQRDEDLKNMIVSLDGRLSEIETPREEVKKIKKRFGGKEK